MTKELHGFLEELKKIRVYLDGTEGEPQLVDYEKVVAVALFCLKRGLPIPLLYTDYDYNLQAEWWNDDKFLILTLSHPHLTYHLFSLTDSEVADLHTRQQLAELLGELGFASVEGV